MTVTPEPDPVPDPPASPPEPDISVPDVPATADHPAPSTHGEAPPWSPPLARNGPAPSAREPGLRFRPAVLLVALLAVVGMMGAIVVFGDDGGDSVPVSPSGGASGAASSSSASGGSPSDVVTISDPSALAPPGGVPVPPSYSGPALEWKTNQDWSAVLAWYYASFPIDKMALDPASFGETTQGGRPIGESHHIIAEGTRGAPGLSPYLEIQEDDENPTGTIVRYFTYD